MTIIKPAGALVPHTNLCQPPCTIEDMRLGSQGYTVGWAMLVSSSGEGYLRPSSKIHPEAGGTVNLRVVRRLDGAYEVGIPEGLFYAWGDDGEDRSILHFQCIPVARFLKANE